MIRATISNIGVLAATRLRESSGHVLAVFDSTIYLRSGEQLFCLVVKDLPRGPLHLNASVSRFQHVLPGATWSFENNLLKISDNAIFSLADAASWTPAIPSLRNTCTTQIAHSRYRIEQLTEAAAADTTGGAGGAASHFNTRLCSAELALQHWLQRPQATVPDTLASLIGCGDGLTPAGDDFLIGAVVTLKYLHRGDKFAALARWIQHHAKGNTGDISQAHLLAGCEGLIAEPVHDLLCAVCSLEYSEQRINQCCEAVCAIGHSSGLYTLRGIAAVLATI